LTALCLTRHAADRLQKRGIPPIVVELLDRFGAAERCGEAERLYFDRRSEKRMREFLGGARSMRVVEPWLNTYAVISDDGAVITVGHRQHRFRRK
jgi:hypothetical protein